MIKDSKGGGTWSRLETRPPPEGVFHFRSDVLKNRSKGMEKFDLRVESNNRRKEGKKVEKRISFFRLSDAYYSMISPFDSFFLFLFVPSSILYQTFLPRDEYIFRGFRGLTERN